jgi:hypothetical protein
MKVFISVATFAASFGIATQPSTAAASPWCHEYQNSVDGSRIQMDNEVGTFSDRFSSFTAIRKNTYLHVSKHDFTGNENVRFVLMSQTKFESRPGSGGDIRNVTEFIGDAQWDPAAARFTVRAGPNPRYSTADAFIFAAPYRTHQEVAVVVDGKWLQRPDGGGSNFIFDANNYADFCANPN